MTGTLFAVVVAFLILAAFQTYDGARAGAATEGNALLDMSRSAALYPAAQRDRLRANMVASLLDVYFLDHPYQPNAGGIQPNAMRHTLVMLRNLEPGLRLCTVSGRPA